MPSNRTEALRAAQRNSLQRNAPLSCYIAAPERGPTSLPCDEHLPICTRDSFGALCALSRAFECTETHARGLRGMSVGSADSEASYGREYERSDRAARATRGSASAQFPMSVSPWVRIRTRPDLLEFAPAGAAASIPETARTPSYGEGSCVCGGALCARCVPDARSPSRGEAVD
ncbi:hypothetical protein FB451DRAFT_1568680 [Mycena latifolia]|nr:hypothetical protein FB451DRAFT_1568680 [Mycena latifolia]